MLELDSSELMLSWAGVNLAALLLFATLELISRWRERRAGKREKDSSPLDALIERTEREESRTPRGPEPGSDDWWSTWAETGGRLPSAADSCRPPAVAPSRTKGIGDAVLARGLSRYSAEG